MDPLLIHDFLVSNKEKFTIGDLENIKRFLENSSTDQYLHLSKVSFTSPGLMLAVSFFLGYMGIDRMALGEVGLGFLKLITCGGCGLWWIADLFLIMKKTREFNHRKFLQNIV